MTISVGPLLKGTAWTIGAYGIGQALRLVTNVILARLLMPELFGIMLIINSIMLGITLFSDFGIGQNIIYNKNATQPAFYNTAWSLELIRNFVLCLACLVAAAPLAHFYESPILIWVLPISAMTFLLTGLTSISRYLLQKRMEFAKLNMFEMVIAFISSAAHIVFAYLSPTIWALVFGGLVGSAATMIGSHFLLSDVRHKLFISKQYSREILAFGKWVFVSSIAFFLSMNYDRLYLPTVLPLDLLGVYGVARSISELLSGLSLRLVSVVLFPFIASHSQMPRALLYEKLASIRAQFLLLAALAISILVTAIDLAIAALYDERYQAAGWMLPVLIAGTWFSILANVNDTTLVGLGKPSYSAVSNCIRFAFLAVGLPLSFMVYGVLGVVFVFALSDLCRYVVIVFGQRRERLSFGTQDVLLTLAVSAFIGLLEWLRWSLGFGTSFDALPLKLSFFGFQ